MRIRISEYKNACKIHISKAKNNPSNSGEQFLEENVSQVQDGLNPNAEINIDCGHLNC